MTPPTSLPPPLETTAEELASSPIAVTYAKLPLRELFSAVQQEDPPWPK